MFFIAIKNISEQFFFKYRVNKKNHFYQWLNKIIKDKWQKGNMKKDTKTNYKRSLMKAKQRSEVVSLLLRSGMNIKEVQSILSL